MSSFSSDPATGQAPKKKIKRDPPGSALPPSGQGSTGGTSGASSPPPPPSHQAGTETIGAGPSAQAQPGAAPQPGGQPAAAVTPFAPQTESQALLGGANMMPGAGSLSIGAGATATPGSQPLPPQVTPWAPGGPGPSPVLDAAGQGQDAWERLWEAHAQDREQQMELARNRASIEGVRAANLSAGTGLGGQFQAGQAQANLMGRQMEMEAQQKHAERGLELQMTNLQEQWRRANMAQDHERAKELQEMLAALALELEGVRLGSGIPAGGGGGGDGGSGLSSQTLGMSSGDLEAIIQSDPDLRQAASGYAGEGQTIVVGQGREDDFRRFVVDYYFSNNRAPTREEIESWLNSQEIAYDYVDRST